MGSVDKIQRQGSPVWRARWRDLDGRQRVKTFARHGDADRFLAGVSADLNRGAYIDPHDKTILAEYALSWASGRPHRPTTQRRVRSLIDTHIAGTPLGCRRLSSVRPSEVQAWVSGRPQVLAPSTLRNLVSLLRSIYASAVLDRLVATSPVVRVALPTAERPRWCPSRSRRPSACRRDADEEPGHGHDAGRPRPTHRRAAGAPCRGRRLPAQDRARRVADPPPGARRAPCPRLPGPVAPSRCRQSWRTSCPGTSRGTPPALTDLHDPHRCAVPARLLRLHDLP